jgi:hypothetical protein
MCIICIIFKINYNWDMNKLTSLGIFAGGLFIVASQCIYTVNPG